MYLNLQVTLVTTVTHPSVKAKRVLARLKSPFLGERIHFLVTTCLNLALVKQNSELSIVRISQRGGVDDPIAQIFLVSDVFSVLSINITEWRCFSHMTQ